MIFNIALCSKSWPDYIICLDTAWPFNKQNMMESILFYNLNVQTQN